MSGHSKFRLGTRKSLLAKAQSSHVARLLEKCGLECDLIEIESSGDIDRTTPLYEMDTAGSPGFFTKELETELLAGRIDLAVHSLKDLPTEQPSGLKIGAIPERVAADDCLIIRKAVATREKWSVALGAKVGTSSLRREAELLSERPDLNIVPVRGNVPTRLSFVGDGKLDAVVLARAGMNRLALDLSAFVVEALPEDRFVPAPGQGALAVEIREEAPRELIEALAVIHDRAVALETRVERAVLKGLHGGCSLPLGVRCWGDGRELKVKAFLGVLKATQAGQRREWVGFHHFDISGQEPQTLVDKTIQYFKNLGSKEVPRG